MRYSHSRGLKILKNHYKGSEILGYKILLACFQLFQTLHVEKWPEVEIVNEISINVHESKRTEWLMHDKPLLKCSLDSLDGVPNSLRSSVFSDWPIKRLDAGYDVYLSQSYGTLSMLSRQITILFLFFFVCYLRGLKFFLCMLSKESEIFSLCYLRGLNFFLCIF